MVVDIREGCLHSLLSLAFIFLQILEGLLTICVGLIAYFGGWLYYLIFPSTERGLLVIIDVPAKATFLTPAEREYIIWRKSKLVLLPL